MEKLSNILKSKREELGLTQEDLAKKVGVKPVYISQLERGIRETPSDDVSRKLAKALRLDETFLLKSVYQERLPPELREFLAKEAGAIYVPSRKMVPILNRAKCGEWKDTNDLDFPAGCADEFEPSDSTDPHAFYVKAEGDSMIGFGINEGDLLLVEPSRQVESGNIVLAIYPGNDCTVKKYFKRDNEIELRPGNENYPSMLLRSGDERFRVYRIGEIKRKI